MHEDKDLLMRRVAAYVSILMVIGFFACIGMLAWHEVPDKNRDILQQLLGALTLAFGGLMGYLYGSSKSGESKDRALAAAAAAPVVIPPNGGGESVPVTITNANPVDVSVVKP